MVKSIGIVRKMDDLNRVVIPIELKRTLGFVERQPLEICTDGETVILRKYQPGCIICGSMDGLTACKSKQICSDCRTSN